MDDEEAQSIDIERPEEIEPLFQETEEITDYDLKHKWYGVPPKGERPVYNKWKYVLLLLGIIVLEICLWAVYRWSTAEWFQSFGTHQFYLAHIIAAPTIHLLPIIFFWWFVRNERGLPFVFTKKLLLTGIIIGFIAAIIWRLLEEFLYIGFAGMAGGQGEFTFLNLLETADLFILMTFVMYFIVGPVEELEFRGFTQDQGARALSNWGAVIFSSVLFGCSHIPIAVFVYQLPPTQFIDALIGWISAGFTFGVLYMYSRNIFACIVMHGMGNWQLSVFYFTGASAGMGPTTAMYVGIATSLTSNIIMIAFFYFIHKYYWEPHRHGEPAFNGILLSLQRYMHEHDFEERPLISTIMVFTLFIAVISGGLMGVAYAFGFPYYAPPETAGDDATSAYNLEMMDLVEESGTNDSRLDEGSTETISINSQQGKYLQAIDVTVTWTDEEDRYIRYQNQPDTFQVLIRRGNWSESVEGHNPQGGQGSLSIKMEFTDENITDYIETEGDIYGILVEITLLEAGDQMKRSGLGGLYYNDVENHFTYTLNKIWLVQPE